MLDTFAHIRLEAKKSVRNDRIAKYVGSIFQMTRRLLRLNFDEVLCASLLGEGWSRRLDLKLRDLKPRGPPSVQLDRRGSRLWAWARPSARYPCRTHPPGAGSSPGLRHRPRRPPWSR